MAHLALAIAASFAFTAALTRRLGLAAGVTLPLALAHLAFAAATIAALPAALKRLLPFLAAPPLPLTLAHLALAAAAIFARAAADMRRRRRIGPGPEGGVATSEPSLEAMESIWP